MISPEARKTIGTKSVKFITDTVKGYGLQNCKEVLINYSYFTFKAKILHIYAHKTIIKKAITIWNSCQFEKLDLNIEYDENNIGTIIIDYTGIFACHAWLDIFYACLKISALGAKDFLNGIKILQNSYGWHGAIGIYTKVLESSNKSIGKINFNQRNGMLNAFNYFKGKLDERKVRRKVLKNYYGN